MPDGKSQRLGIPKERVGGNSSHQGGVQERMSIRAQLGERGGLNTDAGRLIRARCHRERNRSGRRVDVIGRLGVLEIAGEVDIVGAVECERNRVGRNGAAEERAVEQSRAGWIQLGDKQSRTLVNKLGPAAGEVAVAARERTSGRDAKKGGGIDRLTKCLNCVSRNRKVVRTGHAKNVGISRGIGGDGFAVLLTAESMQVGRVDQLCAVGADLGHEAGAGAARPAAMIVGVKDSGGVRADRLESVRGCRERKVVRDAREDNLSGHIHRHAVRDRLLVARTKRAEKQQCRIDGQFAAMVIGSQLEADLMVVGDNEAAVHWLADAILPLIDHRLVEANFWTTFDRQYQIAIGCQGRLGAIEAQPNRRRICTGGDDEVVL